MAGAEEKPADNTAPPPADAPVKTDPKKKPAEDPDADLSEEDRALKEKLQLMVSRAMDADQGVQKLALETIRTEIRSATSSMTSVPKPLKFLRPHFLPLKSYYAKTIQDGPNKVFLADILSVLAMTMGNTERRESLRFKLRGSRDPPHLWGHEYVRHLAGEIAHEYRALTEMDIDSSLTSDPPVGDDSEPVSLLPATLDEIHTLVADIVPFLISSNAEPEAVDLLMEVESLHKLVGHTDEHNFARVCLYLKSCADYLIELKDVDDLLKITAQIYIKAEKHPEAMQVAIRLGDLGLVTKIYKSSPQDSSVRLQLALDLGRAGILLDEDVEDDDDMRTAMSNRKLSEQFLHLAKDLDVLEPKVPEDIYKTHLLDQRAPSANAAIDSARANLASTYVNAFVNMAFGKDKLMMEANSKWIYRNKDHGMMSAAASLGMIMLWDVDGGLADIDKYMYVEQEYVRAGAFLGVGLVSANVRHPVDPPLAILAEHVTSSTAATRHGAIAGLGIAYAGSNKQDVKDMLLPVLTDDDMSLDTTSIAALSLGLVYIGSADEDLSAALLQVLSDRKDSLETSKDPLVPIFLPLALGLIFLGRQEAAEIVAEPVEAMVGNDNLIGRITSITLQACAYYSSGNVLKVQKFLSICGEHPTSESGDEEGENPSGGNAARDSSNNAGGADGASASPSQQADGGAQGNEGSARNAGDAASAGDGTSAEVDGKKKLSDEESQRIATAEQAVAVLGIAMVAMGEELGAEMSIRAFGHLLQYGDAVIRRVVPLAIGLLSISHPKIGLTDMLSKFTHDSDMHVAQAAIMGLGLIGAGTNNSRIAGILRQLSVYYSREPSSLFLVRVAQGVLHAGKGLVTMSPFYGDNKFLENKNAVGGLLTVLFACLDMKGTILGKNHFLLYFLGLAARPRMVFTVDKNMEFVSTSVRVGQAVDTVGQAGRPKSITGFQTHSTPVLLAAGERAEMATEEFLTEAAALEGVVVIDKNPDWQEESGLAEAVEKMEKMQTMTDAGRASASSSGAGPSAAPSAAGAS
eukprot:GFKZ01013492.1.p1 GENE.GFKZ01013492.1~~GFKZ01013492.1.p1  ORF type:complete len:1030 (+),score=203.73 GFKZ01013492.1:282-3371(+)